MKLIHGDCLEKMKDIPDKSIDMILCDLPYGTTSCKWDVVIPFEPLWEQYKRIIKDRGAIVLFGSEPFSSTLVCSNLKLFRHDWIWQKNAGSNFGTVRFQPMREHEHILVFGKASVSYYPILQERAESGKDRVKTVVNYSTKTNNYNDTLHNDVSSIRPDMRVPSSVQKFNRERGLHPTQKPVALLEYLIKTYTLEGETVLDNCMGSFSTAIACLNTKRSFIGIEKDAHYFQVGKDRVEKHLITLDYNPEIVYHQV